MTRIDAEYSVGHPNGKLTDMIDVPENCEKLVVKY